MRASPRTRPAKWATQKARNIIETFVERQEPIRFLIRDRDSKFTAGFDEVFRTNAIRTIRTPVRPENDQGGAPATKTALACASDAE